MGVGALPQNTRADLRDAFDGAGYEWVTSHVFRKTVAMLMDEAGLSSRATADQLGHANPSLTQDVYYGRKVTQPAPHRLWRIWRDPELRLIRAARRIGARSQAPAGDARPVSFKAAASGH